MKNILYILTSLVFIQFIGINHGQVSDGDPIMPRAWPPAGPQFITGAFLQDPIIQKALAYVNKVVPPAYLNIPKSDHISGPQVNYNGDVSKNCYWPGVKCIRTSDDEHIFADMTTCPQNQWGMSFDDGPTQSTGDILTSLKDLKVKATFFVVGAQVNWQNSMLARIDEEGHQIASHSWTHLPLTSLTNEQIVAEVKYTEAAIFKVIKKVPMLIRPPYGDVDDRVRAIVNALGYSIAMWERDDQASAEPEPRNATNVEHAVSEVRNTWFKDNIGFISLHHDIVPFTAQVALTILDYYRNNKNTISQQIVPIGTCSNKKWYRGKDDGQFTPSSSSPIATPTQGSKLQVGEGSISRHIVGLATGVVLIVLFTL